MPILRSDGKEEWKEEGGRAGGRTGDAATAPAASRIKFIIAVFANSSRRAPGRLGESTEAATGKRNPKGMKIEEKNELAKRSQKGQ